MNTVVRTQLLSLLSSSCSHSSGDRSSAITTGDKYHRRHTPRRSKRPRRGLICVSRRRPPPPESVIYNPGSSTRGSSCSTSPLGDPSSNHSHAIALTPSCIHDLTYCAATVGCCSSRNGYKALSCGSLRRNLALLDGHHRSAQKHANHV